MHEEGFGYVVFSVDRVGYHIARAAGGGCKAGEGLEEAAAAAVAAIAGGGGWGHCGGWGGDWL